MRVCLSLVYMVVYCYNLVARVFSIPCKGVIRPVIVFVVAAGHKTWCCSACRLGL